MVVAPVNTSTSGGGNVKPMSKWTPPKGRKSKSDIKPASNGSPGWYLRSCLLHGGIEAIFITTAALTEDAYYNPILVALGDPAGGMEDIKSIGLMGAYYMRCSLANTGRLMNYRKGNQGDYQRRAFIRIIDEGEESGESRLAALRVIKAFLEAPANNRFRTKVYIQEHGWDMSTDQEPRKVDNFLEYTEIAKIISALFDGVDGDWAQNNMDAAMCYFTAGHIPFAAHAELGFPLEAVEPEVSFFSVPPTSLQAGVAEVPGMAGAEEVAMVTAMEVPVAASLQAVVAAVPDMSGAEKVARVAAKEVPVVGMELANDQMPVQQVIGKLATLGDGEVVEPPVVALEHVAAAVEVDVVAQNATVPKKRASRPKKVQAN